MSAKEWIEQIARGSENFALVSLKYLVTRGMLVEQQNRFLWRLQSRTYPMIDGEAERNMRARIQATLFSDEVPDPNDIVIVNLPDACGLFRAILGDHNSKRRPRADRTHPPHGADRPGHDRCYPRNRRSRRTIWLWRYCRLNQSGSVGIPAEIDHHEAVFCADRAVHDA